MTLRTWRIWRTDTDGKIDEFLRSCKVDDDLILLLHQEHEILDNYDYAVNLSPFNSVKIIIGTYDIKHLGVGTLKNVEVIMCPLFFVYLVMHEISIQQMPKVPKFSSKKIKQHFLTLNGRPSIERIKVLDQFAKYNMLTNTNHSWHGGNQRPIETKFWNQAICKLDGNDFLQTGGTILPKHAKMSLLYIANESTIIHPFITEKTFRAMRHKIPVISFGYSGINTQLEKFGFRTPKNFIDMSFDTIEDIDKKAEAFAKAIYEFQQIPLQSLVVPFKEIAEHNYNQLLKITREVDKHVPDILLTDEKENFYFTSATKLVDHLTQMSSK